MELAYDFETNAPKAVILQYISDPQNLLKYVPAFKNLKQIDDNTWELEVKWLFTIKLTVTRRMGTDEIDYDIKKTEGLIKIASYLRYILMPKRNGKTVLKIIFFYKGPFESIAKGQTEQYYKRGMKIFEEDLKRLKEGQKVDNNQIDLGIKEDLLNMETVMAKEINKNELEDIVAKAMIESINTRVILLISDGNNIAELKFKDGSLEETKGDINSLNGKIKVLMKRTVMKTNSV